MKESRLMQEVRLQLGTRPDVKLFRNNVGSGWQGEKVQHTQGLLVLRNPRFIRFGLCEGSSDLIGFEVVTVTPDMVGQRIARFLAPETKATAGRATEAQRRFCHVVSDAGGGAGFVRSVDDAVALLLNK